MTPDPVAQLVARAEIQQVALRYCRGVDRLDVELMRSAYHPDAIDDHGVFRGNAHEFCEFVIERHGTKDLATMHCILNHAVEFDDDHLARGEIYNVTYRLRNPETQGPTLDTMWGRYADRYERRDGVWAISYRTWVHEFSHQTQLRRAAEFDQYFQGITDRGGPPVPLGPEAFAPTVPTTRT